MCTAGTAIQSASTTAFGRRQLPLPGGGIGPRDTSCTTLGGNLYAIGTVELAFPNGLPEEYGIKTALFTDFGTEGVLDKKYKETSPGVPNELQSRTTWRCALTVGLSIKWKSPMGPVDSISAKFMAKTDYDKTELFRFSTYAPF